MKVKIIIEDDGTYGTAIRIGDEYIFTVGKNCDDLRKNIDKAMLCAFGKQAKKEYKIRETYSGLTKLCKIREGR